MIFSRFGICLAVVCASAASVFAAEPAKAPALRTLWRFSTPAASESLVSVAANTVLASDREGNLCAISATDGKELWTTKLPAAVSSPAAVEGSMAVLGDEEGTLHALALADGKPVWSYKTGGKIVGRPLVTADQVVAGSYDNSVHSVKLETGALNWRFATTAQVHAGAAEFSGQLITGGCDGQLRAIDPATGQQRWALDLQGVIATTPVIADKLAIVGTMEGELVAVDAAGEVAWKVKPLKEPAAFTATPAIVADRVVFVADDGQVASVQTLDGGGAVTGMLQAGPSANLLAFEGFALVGTDDGKIEMLDAGAARSVRRITLGGRIRGLAARDGLVVANTDEGAVWGLSVPNR